jgi:shikimate kinase/3-dehydroquinate synthase
MITWLIGPSGAGKTTVGQALAARLDVAFHDVDAMVEERTGQTIEQIFGTGGEAAFRRHEWNAILELAETYDGDAVVALGGGAVADASVRGLIRGHGLRIFLDVDGATAIERLERGASRPLLLEENPLDAWQRLYRRRERYYRDSDVRIAGEGSVDDTVARIAAAIEGLQRASWSVEATIAGETSSVEGYASLIVLLSRMREIVGTRRALIVTDSILAAEYAELLTNGHADGQTIFTVDAGEQSKSFACAERVIRVMAQSGLTRDDVVVAFGGGVVTDLAGFAASVYMRGIEALYVPTTLLAMVDAAIGGKTALDVAGVRNLVGTVRQPRHVLISPSLLRTLPAREICSGFVESVKMGIANSDELARACDAATRAILEGELPENLDDVLRLSVATKLEVVGRDAFDMGARLSLNFGHTFGHALEAVEAGRHAHGEAVAFGIAAATYCARELGVISADRCSDVVSRVASFARPVGVEHDPEAIAAAMFTDKKRTSSGLRLVLPAESTGVVIHETTDRGLLVRSMRAALDRIAADGADPAARGAD